MADTKLTPEEVEATSIGEYKYGFHDEVTSVFRTRRGLNEDVVRDISAHKEEPEWMTDFRLDAYRHCASARRCRPGAPTCPRSTSTTSTTTSSPPSEQVKAWDELPDEHARRPTRSWASPRPSASTSPASPRSTSPRSSTTTCEGPRDAGRHLHWTWTRRCASTRSSCKQYFGTVIPPNDNKFAALNSAVWSGGSFIYVPPGVHVEMPLQAYFRINAENMGQFERTLIIADEAPRCTTSRAARRRSTPPTRCTPRWSRSRGRGRAAAATPPSRTGRTTSSTWSPSGRSPRRRPPWSGSTATSARSSP